MAKKSKNTINITSVTTTDKNPYTLPIEPIYKNLFHFIAKDANGNKQDVLSEQVYSVTFPSNSSFLELKVNLNQGLVTSIISGGMTTKTIKVGFHGKDGRISFELDYSVIYRNYEGIDGDYASTSAMELTLYYQIVDIYLSEEVDGVVKKVRLK